MSQEKHLSFAIGTTVGLIESEGSTSYTTGIITAVSVANGELEYAVSGNAWYKHAMLEFVSAPTRETIEQAIITELDEDDEDGDSEDDD